MRTLMWFLTPLCAGLLLIAGCSDRQIVDPVADDASPRITIRIDGPTSGMLSKSGAPVIERVSGSGSFIVPPPLGTNDRRTFAFTAYRFADGTVDGEWERIRRQPGNAKDTKSHGRVTCFTIVGNNVWIGGYATSGLFSDPPFNEGAWRVVDNGQGANSEPDQMSLEFVAGGPGTAEAYCNGMPEAPRLFVLEAGNITIRQ